MPILLLPAVYAVAVLATPLETLAPQGPGPFNLTLTDQFGHRCAVADNLSDVLVFVYGDKQVLSTNHQVRDHLTAIFHPASSGHPGAGRVKPVADAPPGSYPPDVHVATVACLQGYPTAAAQALVRHQFAVRWPHSIVLVDFQNTIRQTFGLTPGVCHVLVFDTHGRVRLRMVGEVDDASFATLVQGIEALRKEAVVESTSPKQ